MSEAHVRFSGFRPAAFAFFRELRDNNDPAWFKPRKAVYETEVLAPFRELIGRGRDRFAGSRVTAHRRPQARHLPHLSRRTFLIGQAAVQDARRGGADALRPET